MITEYEYFVKPHTLEQTANAAELLRRREALRAEFRRQTGRDRPSIDPDTGTEISGIKGGDGDGGFRTPSAPGAPRSSHKLAMAVDDFDGDNAFDTWLDQFEDGNGGNSMLEEYDLYREHPSKTPTWCHLTTRAPASGKRTFYP